MTDENKKLTVAEVAAMLRLSRSFVYAEIERGALKASRFGKGKGTIRIDMQDYLDYWNRHTLTMEEQPCHASGNSRTAAGRPTIATSGEVSRELSGLLTRKGKRKTGSQPCESRPTIVCLGAENDTYSGRH